MEKSRRSIDKGRRNMNKSRRNIVIIAIVLIIAAAGVMSWQASKTNKVGSIDAVIKSLDSKGFKLEDFTDDAAVNKMYTWVNNVKAITVDGEDVYIYSVKMEYSKGAEKSAEKVVLDSKSFLYGAHIYTGRNLVVFYIGKNEKIQNALKDILVEYKK